MNEDEESIKIDLNRAILKITTGAKSHELKEWSNAYKNYKNGLELLIIILKENNIKDKMSIESLVFETSKRLGDVARFKDKEDGFDPKEKKDNKNKDKNEGDNIDLAVRQTEERTVEKITESDIIGLVDAKRSISLALRALGDLKTFFQRTGIKPRRNFILYGPPGNGKTLVAKWIATESGSTFYNVPSSTLLSRFIGTGPKVMKRLFQIARKNENSVIFFDEAETILKDRGSGSGGESDSASNAIITEFLTQMDGVGTDNSNLIVLMATNLPRSLDTAVLRRFDQTIPIPLPNKKEKGLLIKKLISNPKFKQWSKLSSDDINTLSSIEKTGMFSSSDITRLFKNVLNEKVSEVSNATHFENISKSSIPIYIPVIDNSILKGSEFDDIDMRNTKNIVKLTKQNKSFIYNNIRIRNYELKDFMKVIDSKTVTASPTLKDIVEYLLFQQNDKTTKSIDIINDQAKLDKILVGANFNK